MNTDKITVADRLFGPGFHRPFDLLTMFTVAAGIFGLVQFLYVWPHPEPVKFVTLSFIVLMLLYPQKPVFLALFAASSIIEYLLYAPIFSNHMFMAFLLWTFVSVSWVVCALRDKTWDVNPEAFYKLFAPPGRLLLLVMYFFGVFHKINTPFLTPEVSCASTVISFFVFLPKGFVFPEFAYYTASYGTLIVETVIALMLLSQRTRYFAVVTGILFHLLIATSAYRFYVPFTMFSITMHFLYMDAGALGRLRSGIFKDALAMAHNFSGRFALAMPLFLGFALFYNAFDYDNYTDALWIWMCFGLVITAFVAVYDRPPRGTAQETENVHGGKRRYFLSPFSLFNVIAAMFFLSCFSPYFGFKTAHTLNMFSNLHTEGGRSNHLVFREPIGLFDYQEDLVRILETEDPGLDMLLHEDLAMVGVQFENYMAANPGVRVKYERDGEVHELVGLTPEQKEAFTHNPVFRRFVLFNIVNTAVPRNCLDVTDIHRMRHTPELERWFSLEELERTPAQ